jgi:hypothetical protein
MKIRKRQDYESPEIEVIFISTEGNLCISGDGISPTYNGFNDEEDWSDD